MQEIVAVAQKQRGKMCERKIDVGANGVRRKSAPTDTNRARLRRKNEKHGKCRENGGE